MRQTPLVLSGYGVDGTAERAQRSSQSLENPSVSLTDPKAWAQIFGDWRSSSGVSVDYDVAMTVPAIWCAVTFLSGCIASMPLRLQKESGGGREVLDKTNLSKMLTGTVNDEYLTSFKWRRNMMTSTLLTGRGMTYIERYGSGDARYLWPFETVKTTAKRRNGKLLFDYRENTTGEGLKTYAAADVVDIQFLGKLNGVGVFDPVQQLKDTIGLAVAMRSYGSRYFQRGGTPPLSLSGPAASPQAVARANADIDEKISQATQENSNILYMPPNHTLTPIGFDPEKSQLLDAQRFIVEETSRMYNLPPSFLHSLLNMPFATVEQQDLNVIKHNIVHWCEQIEQELNAKIFGSARGRFVAFDLDGLMRGDLLSRMQAYAQAIQNAVYKPNEARRKEGLPDAEGGDQLYMNGAIAPIGLDDPASDALGETLIPGDPASDPAVTGDPGSGVVDPADPDPTVAAE